MPRLPRLLIPILLALAAVLGSATLGSVPMYTDLGTIRKAAPIVVIGTVRNDGAGLVVDVERSLLGGIRPGPLSVLESPDGHVIVKPERLVAFIDGQRALRWVGQLIAGPSLEQGVMRIEGFYDFNAHIVSPGVMTLNQLQQYLRSGHLTQAIQVNLTFPDAQGKMQPSTQKLQLVYNAISRQTTWRGIKLKCFPKQANMISLDWGRFQLQLQGTCPGQSTARRLYLEGTFAGANLNTGTLLVNAFPERPFLSEADFQRFAHDASVVDVQHKIQIELSDGVKYVWEVGRKLVSPSGREHMAGGISLGASSQPTPAGVQSVSHVTYQFGKIRLSLTPATTTASPGGRPASIIPWIARPDPKTCRMIGPAKRNRTCNLALLPSELVTAPAGAAAGAPAP